MLRCAREAEASAPSCLILHDIHDGLHSACLRRRHCKSHGCALVVNPRHSMQARHPCEIVWAEPESATSQMAAGTAGSASFGSDGFSLPEVGSAPHQLLVILLHTQAALKHVPSICLRTRTHWVRAYLF